MKRIAVLLDADGERYLLPVLDKVRQLAVNDRGMLLTGIEIYPLGSKAPQTWWCLLGGSSDKCPSSCIPDRDALPSKTGATEIGPAWR
ncbi:hypothetical protein WKW80_24220 [Variovorax humicola]|uniref:Uncharacterized protein n=1 Tax=Variovorax humicola TaxID=1769758 RepID=A0ABU8W740_9BURK